VWWAVVTVTTVGYGDIVPTSILGKIAGVMIILSGPALLSLITASAASMFVERRMKEVEGLETIKDKDHVVICGWNENSERVIEGILAESKGGREVIVLINELDREDVQSIQYKYRDHNLKFVRGNYVKQHITFQTTPLPLISSSSGSSKSLEKSSLEEKKASPLS
jgi:voltage-gated potassium channel